MYEPDPRTHHDAGDPAKPPRTSKRVPLSEAQASLTRRLRDVRAKSAVLTTFNEVDLEPLETLFARHGATFSLATNSCLSITSFLVTAAVRALRRFPALNAARDGTDVLFRRYCDIAISVEVASGARSTLLRNAECMSFAAIEAEVWPPPAAESPEPPFEDDCGTFRLLQCGLAGAMLSTPQLYPGHAAALAAHEIRHRAVAVSSRVEIRRMMYIALTYDHCVVDGSESVQFLYAIKASLERPETLLTRELPEAPSPPAQLRPRIRVA